MINWKYLFKSNITLYPDYCYADAHLHRIDGIDPSQAQRPRLIAYPFMGVQNGDPGDCPAVKLELARPDIGVSFMSDTSTPFVIRAFLNSSLHYSFVNESVVNELGLRSSIITTLPNHHVDIFGHSIEFIGALDLNIRFCGDVLLRDDFAPSVLLNPVVRFRVLREPKPASLPLAVLGWDLLHSVVFVLSDRHILVGSDVSSI